MALPPDVPAPTAVPVPLPADGEVVNPSSSASRKPQPQAVEEEPAPAVVTSSVLRLRGLPFSAADEDIRDFFKAFSVQAVFICKRNGRATGEAYVQLDAPSSATQALENLNRQHMGHRYIEVFDSSEADMSTAKAMSIDRLKGYVVRTRGLPYSASASDVLRFFTGLDVVRGMEGVVFTYTPDGRPTGEAYVEFQNEDGQKEAMKKHKESIGARYIELFISTKADMLQAIQHNRMILGYANRKRWLTQANGMQGPPPMGFVQANGAQGNGNAQGPTKGGPAGGQHGQYGQAVEEFAELFSGFNMGQSPQHQHAQAQQPPQPPHRMVTGAAGSGPGGGAGGVAMSYGNGHFDLQQQQQEAVRLAASGGRGGHNAMGNGYGMAPAGAHNATQARGASGSAGRPAAQSQHPQQQQQQQQQLSQSYGQQQQQQQHSSYLLQQQYDARSAQYDPAAYLANGASNGHDASQQQQSQQQAYFAAAAAAAAAAGGGSSRGYYGGGGGGGGGAGGHAYYMAQAANGGGAGGGGGGYGGQNGYAAAALPGPASRALDFHHLPAGLQALGLSHQPLVGGLHRFDGELHAMAGQGQAADAGRLEYSAAS